MSKETEKEELNIIEEKDLPNIEGEGKSENNENPKKQESWRY